MAIFFGFKMFGQSVEVNQSAEIKLLMDLKREITQAERTYQIQIFTGSVSEANAEVKAAMAKVKLPVSMTFEMPNYKVRIGKFRSRADAEKALMKIRTIYPSAFVVAPRN